MEKLVLVALLLAGASAHAQQAASPYVFADDIAATLRTQPDQNQQAAWQYSRIGRYQAALVAHEKGVVPTPRPLPHADSLAFAAYRPTNAKAYILKRAQHERILIINEAHHVPRHRAFTASLLPELAAQGYHYLAVEDLLEDDSLNWAARRYPVQATGSYVGEPNFGNLLRTAQRQGYQLRCYNYGFSREGDWVARIRAREMAQARNIQHILLADPKAKIVVHCGYSHASEQPDPEDQTRWLASYLREYTGIDPFTVDQTSLSEGAGNPYYQPQPMRESAVLLDARGRPFSTADKYMSVDAYVYHPPAAYIQGRPTWLFTAKRQPVAVASRVQVPYPCQVLAYVAGEPAEAVPVDIIELATKADATALALAPGRYRVVVRSRSGQVQEFELKR
ncbi:hypothetical protein [Hymenobacter sp. BT559]|uniref:hypothetical protein n=1 Tax=Hymenobacter sp. BT559 TaxID=2795729 RepID=UPI0018EE09A7|nr:hypothetical protein [Hymenobacter sp. BT559]MBJ6144269.1 hypothetical protein [Hymenobacter sp. BT559]